MHFTNAASVLSDKQQQVLAQLLQYGASSRPVNTDGQLLLVVPRPGTISPWSSKATDIAHNAGLEQITRIERGIAYYIKAQTALSAEQLETVSAQIHDRMVDVADSLDQVESLFVAISRAHDYDDIIAGGTNALIEANIHLGLALAMMK